MVKANAQILSGRLPQGHEGPQHEGGYNGQVPRLLQLATERDSGLSNSNLPIVSIQALQNGREGEKYPIRGVFRNEVRKTGL
jgi:hypothetical protein